MIYTLLQHQWKSFWRSASAGRNVAMQILMGFMILYLAALAIFAGFSVDKILSEASPGKNVIAVFLGLILYYYAFDIIVRFILQDLPTLVVQPYLTQNIKRGKLVQFLNIRSLFSIFTLLPLFLFLPFITTIISAKYGEGVSLALVICIFSLTFFNNFLVMFTKRKTIINQWWLIGFFVAILLVAAADYFQIFSLRNWSAALFTSVINNPAICVIFIVFAIAAWYNNSRFLRKNFYLENSEKSSGEKRSTDYTFLERFGVYGDLMAIDLKLILRNKRPRMLALLAVIFLFYGYIFFPSKNLNGNHLGFLLFGAIFITGLFMINYGQFLFAWQSGHFDGLMASNMDIKRYIKGKLFLLTSFCSIAFLLSLLYGFLSWKLIPILCAAWLFNIGIHAVLTCFIGTRNYKALNLTKGAAFNYQGTGAAQWLYSFVILIVGAAIYLPFALLINSWSGIAAIGILGLISFLMQDWWLDKITMQFQKHKYKMLEGFREK